MPKYKFIPNTERVLDIYRENSGGLDRSLEFPNGITAELTVTADNEAQCQAIREMITHYPSWDILEEK